MSYVLQLDELLAFGSEARIIHGFRAAMGAKDEPLPLAPQDIRDVFNTALLTKVDTTVPKGRRAREAQELRHALGM